MKLSMHALHAVLAFSLLGWNPVAQADPRPAMPKHSFKGGFSSQRPAAPPPRAPRQDAARGGFGSFGSASSGNAQKSDSALSQRLDRNASESNALRTLDARRAAQDQAARDARGDTRPVPGYEYRQNAPAPPPFQQQQQPSQRSNSGLGGVVTGMVLGQIANGAHARNNGYPGQRSDGNAVGTSSATVNQAPARTSFFGGVMRMFMWLVVLSAIGWLAYFLVQRRRRKSAENKPHYTFEGH
jgi:hypothetical protein